MSLHPHRSAVRRPRCHRLIRVASLCAFATFFELSGASRGQAAVDDQLPASMDAAISSPADPFVYGIPNPGPGVVVSFAPSTGSSRSVVAIGDVNGDGAEDFATGFAPGSAARTLQARDGRNATVLWSAIPDNGGFRGLRTLAFCDGALFVAASSEHGRVERRDPVTGMPAWSVNLAPGGGPMVNLLALQPTTDMNGDGAADLLVAGGRGLNAVRLLSGSNGASLWTHAAGDSVCDVRTTADSDADGIPDVLCCGGEVTPFARLLSGATGAVIWSVGMPGTASVILPLPDIDEDGWSDAAVGVLDAPSPCLFGLGGRNGALLWTSEYLLTNVTALTAVGDIDGDGLADFAVGGFDHAATGVISRTGKFRWRTEGSPVNGGSMFAMANVGDVDSNGAQDLVTCSLDENVYLVDGAKGFFLSVERMRSRGVVTAALNDFDGDGRREMVACGSGTAMVLSGTSGIAAGPVCYLKVPLHLSDEIGIFNFAYPGVPLILLGSPAPGQATLPGFTGVFGLSPATFQIIFVGTAPAAGLSGVVLDPLPRAAIGLTLYFQSVSVFGPGHGAFSNVTSFTVPP